MRALAALAALLVAAQALAQNGCPPPTGTDFSGQNLVNHNFSSQDLRGANFTGAKLDGAQFVGANLEGAIFPSATLAPTSRGPVRFLSANLTRTCFQGTQLTKVDFQYATFACTDFSDSDLTEAELGRPALDRGPSLCGNRTRFAGATMRIRQIPVSLWRYADFTRTRFVDLASFSFRGLDLTDSIFAGVKLAGFDFTGATLTNADLSGTDLRGATLDGVKATHLILTRADFRLGNATPVDLTGGGKPEAPNFTGASLRGLRGQDAELSGAVLNQAVLRGATLTGANLRGAQLQGVLASPGEGFRAADFADTGLTKTDFDRAQLNSANFRDARLLGARITNVIAADAEFPNATMAGVHLDGSTFKGVSFRGATMENASFEKVTFERSPATDKRVDLECTQLGGAALVAIVPPAEDVVTFIGAVMPAAKDCRTTPTLYCGTELAAQMTYGPTATPNLTNSENCPTGNFLRCSGDDWRLPGWKTTACGEPEKRWTPPPPQPAPPEQTVDIPDERLRLCLAFQFFGFEGPITPEFAATVREINCTRQRIADATGLEAFTNLQTLILPGNRLTKGEIFGRLKRLRRLNVAENALTSLDVSGGALKSLIAPNNAITTVTGLDHAQLEYIDLSRNQLTEFALDTQHSAFHADLSNNRLTRIGDLSGDYPELVSLYLANNNLKTIGTLAGARNLTYLTLGGNDGFDCNALQIDKELLEASDCGK